MTSCIIVNSSRFFPIRPVFFYNTSQNRICHLIQRIIYPHCNFCSFLTDISCLVLCRISNRVRAFFLEIHLTGIHLQGYLCITIILCIHIFEIIIGFFLITVYGLIWDASIIAVLSNKSTDFRCLFIGCRIITAQFIAGITIGTYHASCIYLKFLTFKFRSISFRFTCKFKVFGKCHCLSHF